MLYRESRLALRWALLAALVLACFRTTPAALIDTWNAADLTTLDHGDAVSAWGSSAGRTASAVTANTPILRKQATPSGAPSVHFEANRLGVANSPVAGLTSFSLVVVFKADQPGVDEGTGWSTKSGLVDANEAAITNDWGFAIRETGYICFGTSSSAGGDKTVYLDNQPTYPSVADGKYHVVVCTWGGGTETMYMDSYPAKNATGVATTARDNAGFSFGGIHTGESSRQFVGDLAEVRFYDTALTGLEATNLIAQLSDRYLTNHGPVVLSFAAAPTSVYAGLPTTLSWAVSNATAVQIDNGVGTSLAPTGSVQVAPAVTTLYTLTATNAYAASSAQALVTVDPGIPVADPQVLNVQKNTPIAVTLTAHDPQNSNLVFAVVQPPAHGQLAGTPPLLVYTPALNYVGQDFFTFKANDGMNDSLPATVQLFTEEAAVPPHGIFISITELDASASPGAFLAAFRAVDANGADTQRFSLVSGSGDTNNGLFVVNGNQLLAGSGFPLTNGAAWSIRVRATDSAGLYCERIFALTGRFPDKHLVLNEIHYNPTDNIIREEFIELHNPADQPVDLSLWRLRGGIDFVFPPGASIGAGQYAVVASNPATLQSRYGVTAFGPWTGNLSSDGERLTLRDPSDAVVDEVEYRSEFPWPVAANGEGASMELINPGLDNNLGSSWASPLNPTRPSPGARNQVFLSNAPPNIRQVEHSPRLPASTNTVRVTAKVTDPQGVNSVLLQYQVVAPGSYIPSYLPFSVSQLNLTPLAVPPANPAFESATNWTAVPMHDDGLAGDEVTGDDIYTAVLPVTPNRSLVRYRITCADGFGQSRRAPFADDASLNFAYFVYDGVPAYGGIQRTNLESLPLYFVLTRANDLDACTAYSTSDQLAQFNGSVANEARYTFNWPAAIVYDGEVYDHVRYRLHGANGRYQPGKRSFRFKLNTGRYFAAKDNFDRPYPRKWPFLTTGKGQSNRGTLTFALNEHISYFLFNKASVPAPQSHFFHWRIVRTVQEAPDLYNGDFYGLSWAQEDYGAEFLETHGLSKGNLYKLINASRSTDPYKDMVGQQRYQGPFAVTNGSDAVRIQTALLNPSDASQTDSWLMANVNYTNWYIYHSLCEAIRNYDTWPSANKNAAWYFDTEYNSTNQMNGRFWTLPWDLTDTWGPTWNSGQDLAWNPIFGTSLHPAMQVQYRNTMRELRDLLFQSDQLNPLIDALAAPLTNFMQADLLRWSNCPPSGSAYLNMPSPGPALSQGLRGYVQDLKNFMFIGGTYGWWADRATISAGGWSTRLDTAATDISIPAKPTLYYVGQSNYPMNSLTFECLPFGDPQGSYTFGALRWRLAEVLDRTRPASDPRQIPPLEFDALWDSGVLSNWNNRITMPGIYVQTNKLYRARVRHMDNTGRWSKWSDPVEFRVSPVDVTALLRENLRISELMYNPPAFGAYSGDDLEFLELQNIGSTTLDLSGLAFTAGISFTFTNGSSVAPGVRWVLGRNTTALQARYPGLVVNGLYTGKLDNGGETVRLSTPAGDTVLEVSYKDSPPWPVTADGLGWSLVLADAVKGLYRASTQLGGSPGAEDPPNTLPAVVLNELLTHTDPPQTDAIELFNGTGGPANIGGWWLTDDAAVPRKFRIPAGTVIPPEGYAYFSEADFNTGSNAFALSSLGDEAYLFSADGSGNLTGYSHGATFGASENGVSLGRYVNSAGDEDFVRMAALTLGTNNSPPRLPPVVISEIMVQPPQVGGLENHDAEFIELQNITATNVPLFSTAFPTNTWRLANAVDYVFPMNVVVPPDGRVLVVGFDPATNNAALSAFRAAYGVSMDVPLFGPWSGHLDNAGENVELKMSDTPELDGSVPRVLLEKVSYRPAGPWPTGAGGTGFSLQRATLLSYANEPTNWFAAAPNPGSLGSRTSRDADGDGVPDLWEMAHGTDPLTADGDADPDGDGFNNRAEWLARTDPQNPASCFKFDRITAARNVVRMTFQANAGCTYSLVAAPSPGAGAWSTVCSVEAAPTNRVITLEQPCEGAVLYRLVTPKVASGP